MFHAYILGMDTFALGLINAAKLIENGELDAFIEKKYESFKSELGEKIRAGKATLAELANHAQQMGTCPTPNSGRQEYLEGIVNRTLFS
jgi:xylose isomerase